jgi:mono/diheme cytochrome c family protein
MPRPTVPALALVTLFAGGTAVTAGDAPPDGPATFNAHVRPILKAYCFECHGEAGKPKGSLDLRLRRLVLQGGHSGPAVVAGRPDDSLLFQRVRDGEMPPGKKKLSAEEVAVIRRWIAAGATVESPEPESLPVGFQITDEDRQFWAFQPIRRPALPGIRDPQSAIRNPIDAFLLDRLQAKGLAYSPEADRVALIRRVTFDLTGLPPTPEQVEAFVTDAAPDAWTKVVDRLLASPHYGERWGRHWLDVAGYADSEGGSPDDPLRADAWKYRDNVIRSFNADKPFDRFVREQLAGDELVGPPYQNLSPDDLDTLTATGFLRMAPDGTGAGGVDQKTARNQVLSDTVKIVSSAFLGLTVGCAQCHNHRYDPIPQTDFYRLRAVFEPAYDTTHWTPPAARRVSLYTDEDRAAAARIEAEAAKVDKERLEKQRQFIEATFAKELEKLPEAVRDPARAARETPEARRTEDQNKLLREHPSLNISAGSLYLYDAKAADELKKLADQAADLRKQKPVEEFIRALTEVPGRVPTTFLHHRGDPDQPRQPLPPGGLAVLDDRLPLPSPARPPAGGTTGRRLALADWLTDPRHPLTARVIVNRVWMHHFGRGLVGTPGDFGRLGERPTHAELLDWLASEFVAGGWRLKRLHRLILTSAAYRQSSRISDCGLRNGDSDGSSSNPQSAIRNPQSIDPDNRLLGRFPLRRLDAEAVRDGMLAVSGWLNSKAFGPPVPVKEDEVGQIVLGIPNRDGAGRFTAAVPLPPGDDARRSVYVQARRTQPLAVLDTFDWATTEPNCESRNSSTATPQALLLLNGDFVIAQSEAFAERVRVEAGPDVQAQAVRAWRFAYGVEPTADELAGAMAFLRDQAELFRAAPPPTPPNPPAPVKGKTAPPAPPLPPEARALAVFCQALLSSNRFLYVD